MKIRIHDDAARRYTRTFGERGIPNSEWTRTLMAIHGKVLDVETEYLFKDQYNTGPIPGVSENGLRIMQESVAEVIDDIRPGLMRCGYCGKTSHALDTCPNCGHTEYLEVF